MSSKNTIIGLLVIAALVIGAIIFIDEANDGPFENAAEELDDAAEDFADEIEN